jgi:hypothetical protein
MQVGKFWANYESVANSYSDLNEQIQLISSAASSGNRIIAWRGQVNAVWPLTSKLYRDFIRGRTMRFTESEFSKMEQKILIELRQWGLHSPRIGGRLSVLSQLAMLQHFGSPTRLIDISFNALVGAFFATEPSDGNDNVDGRLFAVDITDRIINENKHLREWEDSLDTPWSESYRRRMYSELKPGTSGHSSEDDFLGGWSNEWSSHYYAWKPPALDSRIAAQNGGFIFGGIVGARLGEGFIDQSVGVKRGSFQIANPSHGEKWLSIDDVRQVTCLAIKPQKIPTASVRSNTKNAVYSIRISHRAKKDIQGMLRRIFGYTHATIYPDYPGFAAFGTKGIIPN